jgi:hypothetical protein
MRRENPPSPEEIAWTSGCDVEVIRRAMRINTFEDSEDG